MNNQWKRLLLLNSNSKSESSESCDICGGWSGFTQDGPGISSEQSSLKSGEMAVIRLSSPLIGQVSGSALSALHNGHLELLLYHASTHLAHPTILRQRVKIAGSSIGDEWQMWHLNASSR